MAGEMAKNAAAVLARLTTEINKQYNENLKNDCLNSLTFAFRDVRYVILDSIHQKQPNPNLGVANFK